MKAARKIREERAAGELRWLLRVANEPLLRKGPKRAPPRDLEGYCFAHGSRTCTLCK